MMMMQVLWRIEVWRFWCWFSVLNESWDRSGYSRGMREFLWWFFKFLYNDWKLNQKDDDVVMIMERVWRQWKVADWCWSRLKMMQFFCEIGSWWRRWRWLMVLNGGRWRWGCEEFVTGYFSYQLQIQLWVVISFFWFFCWWIGGWLMMIMEWRWRWKSDDSEEKKWREVCEEMVKNNDLKLRWDNRVLTWS